MSESGVPVVDHASTISPSAKALPVQAGERIGYLDLLRGFALAGILFMNIRSFGLVFASYANPTLYDPLPIWDLIAWSATTVIFELKFMTLFSMLFCAGILLFTDRAQQKTGQSALLHYRRMIALLIIGLIHAYVIWFGDILVFYAVFGMLAYLVRNLKPWILTTLAILLILLPPLLTVGFSFTYQEMPAEELAELKSFFNPSQEEIDREMAVFRNGYAGQFQERVKANAFMYSMGFLFFGARVLGNILLGMVLFRWGVITGARSTAFYRKSLWGLAVGYPLILFGIYQNFQHDFAFEYAFFFGGIYNYWGSFAVVLGYIGLVGLWSKSGLWPRFQDRLSAFGRMAFTNYLMQSILCTLFFYGIGLGFFGQLGYAAQLLVVVAVLALQLWWSPVWFHYFRYGPMEWVWRSITYWRWQPNRISNS